jgi:hypothetical protein
MPATTRRERDGETRSAVPPGLAAHTWPKFPGSSVGQPLSALRGGIAGRPRPVSLEEKETRYPRLAADRGRPFVPGGATVLSRFQAMGSGASCGVLKFRSLVWVQLLLHSRGMEQRRQPASRRPLAHFVALLFVVGCGSSLGGTGGSGGAAGTGGTTGNGGSIGSGGAIGSGGGGSSACVQSSYPTTTICCLPATQDPLTRPYICDESTATWVCAGNQVQAPAISGCPVTPTGSGGASGGSVGSGGGGGIGGNLGSGGVGGDVGGNGDTGGLSGHSGANGNCGPATNGQGGSECGKEGNTCCTSGACDSGLRCISGAVCARQCSVDGGVSSCPSGGTCQSTSACCVGTGCAAVEVTVCL